MEHELLALSIGFSSCDGPFSLISVKFVYWSLPVVSFLLLKTSWWLPCWRIPSIVGQTLPLPLIQQKVFGIIPIISYHEIIRSAAVKKRWARYPRLCVRIGRRQSNVGNPFKILSFEKPQRTRIEDPMKTNHEDTCEMIDLGNHGPIGACRKVVVEQLLTWESTESTRKCLPTQVSNYTYSTQSNVRIWQ